ncbi:MAG: DUF3604 domain-containing protein [Gammaproteobacteria bacterium TMED57]|nr:MAG: DUF3604 domain-containing protein [Gammaproteobacteria bacterium TMED57]
MWHKHWTSTCRLDPEKGAVELATTWRFPTYNPRVSNFECARVLENLICSGSIWDALQAGIEPRNGLPAKYCNSALGRHRFGSTHGGFENWSGQLTPNRQVENEHRT